MLIEKALYGLVESSALWYEEIKLFLKQCGYSVHPSDQGIFQKNIGKDVITVCLWVDDFLGWSSCRGLVQELENAVRAKYGDARFDDSDVLNYIGMTISQPMHGVIIIKQVEYTKKIVKLAGVKNTSDSPNHPSLMNSKLSVDDADGGDCIDRGTYLSLLMSAMYLAKRARPDILTPVCILSSRAQEPTTNDMKCLMRVFGYLKGTTDLGLVVKPDSLLLHYWVDASYNLHSDSRGHTGIVATIGKYNAANYVRSQKQKIHTRSSTEAELVAADEAVLHLMWIILIFDALGYPQTPVTVFQDNKSTMRVCQTGQSRSGKLKHMVVRYNFLFGKQEENIIKFEYVKTSNMMADLMSKPVNKNVFRKMVARLLNLSKL